MPRSLPALLAALMFTGCGYIGGPLPPLANIPASVTDLAARQRGGVIVAHFTLPTFTTEHIPLKGPIDLDLRIGVWLEGASVENWAEGAQRVTAPPLTGGLATYEIPAAPWAGKEVVIAARVAGGNGKESGWSNYLVLPVVPAPPKPQDLQAASTPAGTVLRWRANGEHFRILRKTGDETQYAIVAPDVTQHEWTDAQVVPGTAYSYLVQTLVPLGNGKEAESDLAEVRITPAAPPPSAPTALVAVPAPNTIELNWDASTGEVAGYRVYRAVGAGEFEKIADVNAIPAYSDHAVEHGKTYRYAVSAVDSGGREGPRSAVREVLMPQ